MPRLWLTVFLLLQPAIIALAQYTKSITDIPISSDQWVANKITPPELMNGDQVDYPADAKFQHIDGLCLIKLAVGIQGDPQNIHVVHCSDSSFEATSLDAVNKYKFKPATTQEGKPITVTVQVVHHYHFSRYFLSLRSLSQWPVMLPDKRLNLDHHMSKAEIYRQMSKPIRYGFIPQQSGASNPDSDGIYPLTRSVTGPRLIKFKDKGYGSLAFVHEGNSACDVVLTISVKGKASDPQLTHCERAELEKPAVDSLLKSDYLPGLVKNKEVPMRASMHLDYGDVQVALPVSSQ